MESNLKHSTAINLKKNRGHEAITVNKLGHDKVKWQIVESKVINPPVPYKLHSITTSTSTNFSTAHRT